MKHERNLLVGVLPRRVVPWNRNRSAIVSRRSYLKGIGAAVSLGLATQASTGPVTATAGNKFTNDLGEIEDATLATSGTEDAILVQSETMTIAPGIELTSVTRLSERGWLEADMLIADLDNDTASSSLLLPNVANRETISELAEDEVVTGVSGDFFDIGNTGAPLGAEISNETLRKSPAPGRENTISVGTNDFAQIARVTLSGELRFRRETNRSPP